MCSIFLPGFGCALQMLGKICKKKKAQKNLFFAPWIWLGFRFLCFHPNSGRGFYSHKNICSYLKLILNWFKLFVIITFIRYNNSPLSEFEPLKVMVWVNEEDVPQCSCIISIKVNCPIFFAICFVLSFG